MKKLYTLEVRGRKHAWSFDVYSDIESVRAWLEDGLDVEMVVNTVPAWVPAGLVRAWIFLQDLFYFRNPLK